jgi:hypothetical protein
VARPNGKLDNRRKAGGRIHQHSHGTG